MRWGGQIKLTVPMSTIRAIFAVLITLSVAMLPVAGGVVAAHQSGASLTAPQPDCCARGMPCEKKGTNGCGSLAGCVLKCSSFSTAVMEPAAVTPPASAMEKLALITQSFPFASYNPPLPPPRV